MAKEVYLYSGIYSFTAENFIKELEAGSEEEIVARVNSGGGSVFDGYGIITKMQEHKHNVTIKVDGLAASMAFFMLPFADRVECNDVAEFMIHRAAGRAESDQEKKMLARMNKSLRSKMEAKLDIEAFEEITGKTMNDIFDAEERIDVWINAKEAKKIGLVDKINVLSAAEAEEYKMTVAMFAGRKTASDEKPEAEQTSKLINNHNSKTMTTAEFKAQHGSVYADAIAEGIAQERERVNAALVFIDADAKAVKEIIANGESLTPSKMAELSLKAMKNGVLAGLENGSAGELETSKDEEAKKAEAAAKAAAEAKETEQDKNLAAAEAEVFAELGIKEKA